MSQVTNDHERRRLRCLVVGSPVDLKEALSDMIEHLGFAVEHTRSSHDARLNCWDFDVVLFDGTDRLRDARSIKHTVPWARVVLISLDVSEADGIDAVLIKPFTLENLQDALVG